MGQIANVRSGDVDVEFILSEPAILSEGVLAVVEGTCTVYSESSLRKEAPDVHPGLRFAR
jgi:hypothetical protein